LRKENYYWYLLIQVLIYLVIWIALEIDLNNSLQLKFRLFCFSISKFVRNIRDGFFIMIGNFSSIFLTSMDRWLVKFFLTSADFATFSFAVSMEGFINVAISPFTITLFNYFCQEQRTANSHFLRTAGPHFPDSPGHIKRTAWDISRAEGTPPC